MKYKITKQSQNQSGKKIFFISLSVFLLFGAGLFTLRPPKFEDLECDGKTGRGCACPANQGDIRNRNVLIIDTTDPVRGGKFQDIERLITSFGTTPPDLIEWLRSGKRTDLTSVFILSNTPAVDMRPVAQFCAPPPTVAQYAGFKGREIKKLIEKMTERVNVAANQVASANSASQSAIIETLSTVVQSSSYWKPGSTLVLASDLYENTPTCGWFDKVSVIPAANSLPNACKTLISDYQEGLRSKSSEQGVSAVAYCVLPGKPRKQGLQAFWAEVTQGALMADALYSCDPDAIRERHETLNQGRK